MTDDSEAPAEANLFPKTAGERLRDARIGQRLELADIAQRTRIPSRHLQAIEDGDYAGLPTPTYAVGFAKAYARAVGVDEVEVAREVRGQAEVSAARRPEYEPYDTDEPARTPSGGVMVVAAVLALLLLIGGGLYYGTDLFRGEGNAPASPAAAAFDPATTTVPAVTPTPAAGGQVTLVANDEVWLRVYDGAQTLLERTLAPGERYEVPATARDPMVNVGRADKLQVLLNGSAVAPLGDGRLAIRDVRISGAALAARAAGQPAPPPAPAPTGTPDAAAASAPTPPAPRAARSVPAAFRAPAPLPTATATDVAPSSAGQREPGAATPGGTGR